MSEAEDYGYYDRPSRDARMWGMLCHLASLSGYIGVPLGNIIGPLIVWLIKREDDPFIDDQGKESLNFQISMTIYLFVSGLLCIFGLPLILLIGLAGVVFVIIAATKANDGERYRYPLTIRFLS
jgi:uncharacterized protein